MTDVSRDDLYSDVYYIRHNGEILHSVFVAAFRHVDGGVWYSFWVGKGMSDRKVSGAWVSADGYPDRNAAKDAAIEEMNRHYESEMG